MKKLVLLLALSLSFISAYACQCAPLQKLSKAQADSYDMIFLGTVDSVGACEGDKSSAYFMIEQLFKGEAAARTYVNFDCVTDCRMQFRQGERWLIYAEYAKYGDLRVDFCGRSRKHATDPGEDYAIATHGLAFSEELDYIRQNFGVQQVNASEREVVQSEGIPPRELIQPDGTQTIILLAISFAGMVLIWLVVKRFWK